MKALTIRQPWAWAVMEGLKRVENRTWRPPPALHGKRIAIHASAGSGSAALFRANCAIVMDSIERDGGDASCLSKLDELPSGSLVGTVVLRGCVESAEEAKLRFGVDVANWFGGPYGWILGDPVRVTPRPMKGALGLWELPL